jgi:multicomponent Na+:H+ antiporter subunit D
MTDVLVILPMFVHLLAAAAGMATWKAETVQRWIGVAGTVAGLGASIGLASHVVRNGAVATDIGGWPAPYGITFVADGLSAVMVVVAALMGLAVAVYALGEVDGWRHRAGFFPLMHVLLVGVQGAFLTGDLFNLYVCFEIMLMASFVLLALGGERQQMEGAITYVTLNLVASAVFLAAVGLVYGVAGTLNLADLSLRLSAVQAEHPGLVAALAGMLLAAFGIKAGLFPLYAWLPASYHTPPVAVSALFAGLLTKVGVYALLRVIPLVFADVEQLADMLLWVAALTMLFGVIGAVAQFHVRRVLGFHIVSQIGYIVLGLAVAAAATGAVQRLALAAAVFYTAHHIVVKTNLFLISGLIRRLSGGEDLKPLGGLARSAPWLAILFAVPAASLAGIPPLSGFWAKLGVVKAGLGAGLWWAVAAALIAGVLTLMSMVKIWNEAFWKAGPVDRPAMDRAPWTMVVPVAALAAVTLTIGLWPQGLMSLAELAADGVLDQEAYRAAVGIVGSGP